MYYNDSMNLEKILYIGALFWINLAGFAIVVITAVLIVAMTKINYKVGKFSDTIGSKINNIEHKLTSLTSVANLVLPIVTALGIFKGGKGGQTNKNIDDENIS